MHVATDLSISYYLDYMFLAALNSVNLISIYFDYLFSVIYGISIGILLF